MTLLKKITILKIVVIALIGIIMANESHDTKERIPYLFGLFSLFISSTYVFACFKIVDDKHISAEYCALANMIEIFVLFPLVYSVFVGVFPAITCLSFSVAITDTAFFQLTIYKFAYDKASNSPLIKWILGNIPDKKN